MDACSVSLDWVMRILFVCFLKNIHLKKILICLFEKQSERKRENLPLAGSLPAGQNSQGLARQKSGARHFMYITHIEEKGEVLGPSSSALLGHQQEAGLKVEQP